jgi:glycosyltransferase involved in cell wall biosynthesis
LKKQKVIVSVISDLVTDQRVHKVCNSLTGFGYDVYVVGAKRKNSLPVPKRSYETSRISLIFQKGFLMYAEWNLRLFIRMFFLKADIFLANDLDTLVPNFLHSKLRRKKLAYDSHEYFTEQAEVQGRHFVKGVWLTLEKMIFPRLKNVYTVNNSIASIYREKYKVDVKVIRNMPLIKEHQHSQNNTDDKFNEYPRTLIVQGSGLNHDRGLEELVQAMQLLPDTFRLLIIGRGLVLEKLKQMCVDLRLTEKIDFIKTVSPSELTSITKSAFCGFSLDKNTCLNHYYSLPNKLFDYIAAGTPVIASNLPEVSHVVTDNNVGILIDEISPQNIADAVLKLSESKTQYRLYEENCLKAAQYLNWQYEEKELQKIFEEIQ